MTYQRSATAILASKTTIDATETRRISFDIKDSKGREIGARISIRLVNFVAHDKGATYGYLVEPDALGEYWEFEPHATRDGGSYGACQSSRRFRLRVTMENAIDKYLADARKRALKNAK